MFCYFVVHRDLGAWLRNGWKTAAGVAPWHEDLVKEILKVIQSLTRLAVIKIATHAKNTDKHARGNEAADREVKKASGRW